MGKGDKKTRRGKLFIGSHGATRPKKKIKPVVKPAAPVAKAKPASRSKKKET